MSGKDKVVKSWFAGVKTEVVRRKKRVELARVSGGTVEGVGYRKTEA